MGRLLRIAAREYFSYLKTPGFWLSLLIAPVAGAIGGYGPVLADKSAPVRTLAIADLTTSHSGAQMAAMVRQKADPHTVRLVPPPPEAAEAATPDAADAMLKSYVAGDKLLADGARLDAAVVLSGTADALHADLWTREIGDRTLTTLVRESGAAVMRKQRLAAAGIDEATLTSIDAVTPDVREFSPKAAAGRVSMKDRLPTFAAFGLAFTLWFMVLTGAGILLNSVIEEKSNRVLEVLLSSASTAEILGGKILGVAGLAATVLGVWAVAGLVALFHFAPPGLPADLGAALLSKGLLIEFAAYFVLGYLMYASIFVAVGAFCETPREAQTLVGPMMLILAIPMIFLSSAIKRPDTPLLEYLSWFPPFTPFLMTARAASGPPLWEVIGTLLMMVVTSGAVVWLAGRAFRAGALSTAKFDIPAFFRGMVSAGR